MKHKKTIYLTAFLLSLSLIFLLEASSLRLLAEDIKSIEKKKVEIELLLSAPNNDTEENLRPGEAEESKEFQQQKKDNLKENNEMKEEVDKSSSNENEKLITEENNQNQNNIIKEEQLEDEIKTEIKGEIPKKEIKENDESKNQSQKIEAKNNEDDLDKEKDENKSNKFSLESYLADLEKDNTVTGKNEVNESINDQISEKNNIEEDSKSDENKNSTVKEANQKEENKVYDLRTGNTKEITKPGIKNYTNPEYPSNLRKRNIEGEVIVSLKVDKNGQVHDLKINKSSGFDSFDQAALEAVSNWEFEAAEREGKKVQVIVNLPIRFELN